MTALMRGPLHPRPAHPPQLIRSIPAALPRKGSQQFLRLVTATTQLLLAALVSLTVPAIVLLLSQVSLSPLLCHKSISMAHAAVLDVSAGLNYVHGDFAFEPMLLVFVSLCQHQLM